MHIVEVNGIKVYAFHGCIDEEGLTGGNFTVDVKVWTDFKEAIATDNLIHAVDYVKIAEIVTHEMKIRAKLIEVVAHRIIKSIKNEFSTSKKVYVKITKHRAPIQLDVEEVAVIMEE